ncbi:glycosyltransferase family 2 protein [Phycicoccus ginsengisoli]
MSTGAAERLGTAPAPTGRVGTVAVVVPARDEEELLPACLDSIDLARAELQAWRPDTHVTVLVVLDRCTDGTAAVVAARRGVRALSSDAGVVGAVRAAGAAAVLQGTPAALLRHTWLACTDADTTVPRHWLRRQVELAEAGAELVLGTVEPAGLPGELRSRWWARHTLGEGHPHVHGANLGVRGDAYAAAGGFPSLGVDEDVHLVAALRAAGRRCVATDTTRVRTSARGTGRVAEGGFAGYLRRLAVELGVADAEPLAGT